MTYWSNCTSFQGIGTHRFATLSLDVHSIGQSHRLPPSRIVWKHDLLTTNTRYFWITSADRRILRIGKKSYETTRSLFSLMKSYQLWADGQSIRRSKSRILTTFWITRVLAGRWIQRWLSSGIFLQVPIGFSASKRIIPEDEIANGRSNRLPGDDLQFVSVESRLPSRLATIPGNTRGTRTVVKSFPRALPPNWIATEARGPSAKSLRRSVSSDSLLFFPV